MCWVDPSETKAPEPHPTTSIWMDNDQTEMFKQTHNNNNLYLFGIIALYFYLFYSPSGADVNDTPVLCTTHACSWFFNPVTFGLSLDGYFSPQEESHLHKHPPTKPGKWICHSKRLSLRQSGEKCVPPPPHPRGCYNASHWQLLAEESVPCRHNWCHL